MPSSSIRTSTLPASVRWALTRTGVFGGEDFVALSSSSAISRLRSSLAKPTTSSDTIRPMLTRAYWSIDDIVPHTRSTSEVVSVAVSVASRPASTRRFSALRRSRVARWSSRHSSPSRSVSSSLASISSSWESRSSSARERLSSSRARVAMSSQLPGFVTCGGLNVAGTPSPACGRTRAGERYATTPTPRVHHSPRP